VDKIDSVLYGCDMINRKLSDENNLIIAMIAKTSLFLLVVALLLPGTQQQASSLCISCASYFGSYCISCSTGGCQAYATVVSGTGLDM
jgi:hypothetical protein